MCRRFTAPPADTSPYRSETIRYACLVFTLAVIGCAGEPRVTEEDVAQFQQAAESYRQLYQEGGERCAEILSFIDPDIQMIESGEPWSYARLEEYCPYLPSKRVVARWSDTRVISPDAAYDFVTWVFEGNEDRRIRETTARVWRKTSDEWRIIQMNSVLGPASVPGDGGAP